jgi:xanthine dehydrogenase YagS FAD-binding subunit
MGESLVETGENRYHAILGNRGPAKFVNASRFAPALIAWGAKVRIIGPGPDESEVVPLEYFYRFAEVGESGQHHSEAWPVDFAHLAARGGTDPLVSAAYEVLQLEGLDWPLAAASATMDHRGRAWSARLGSSWGMWLPVRRGCRRKPPRCCAGQSITPELAQAAGTAAVAKATPLSNNEYKVQIARTAVKRAILKAVGQLEGGL